MRIVKAYIRPEAMYAASEIMFKVLKDYAALPSDFKIYLVIWHIQYVNHPT